MIEEVASHVPEPWIATEETWGSDDGRPTAMQILSRDRDGLYAASMFLSDDPEEAAVQRANYRRIVACVNACAGISTEVLEKRGVASLAVSRKTA